jgi:DNA-binding transcriptional MerR regulator
VGDVEDGLSIEELAERAGVSVRTIRFYIGEGLLPGPGGRGKAASYGAEHLLRLRLIRLLSERRVPLAEQRERLAALSTEDVRSLLAEQLVQASELERARRAASPREYLATLLEQARRERQPPMPNIASQAAGPAPHAAPPPARAPAEPTGVRASIRGVGEDAPQYGGGEPGADWRRWTLAPGLELHARADAQRRFRDLIEHIVRLFGRKAGG